MKRRAVLLILMSLTLGLEASPALSRTGLILEDLYLPVPPGGCTVVGGTLLTHGADTYCRLTAKFPAGACYMLYWLDVSLPANADVPLRIRKLEEIVKAQDSAAKRDAKVQVYNARKAMLHESFALTNPVAWDFEQGYEPLPTVLGPGGKAYAHYLDWLQEGCVVEKMIVPDFPGVVPPHYMPQSPRL